MGAHFPGLSRGFNMYTIAVTHALPLNFSNCIRDLAQQDQCPSLQMVDCELTDFRSLLCATGLQVHIARHSMDLPDALFAHDVACPFYGLERNALLLLSMRATEREKEVDKWRSFYNRLLPSQKWSIVSLQSPNAFVEGGDIAEALPNRWSSLMRPVYFVGLSKRTNQEGLIAISNLAETFGVTVEPVSVGEECLHLESGATILAGEVLLDPRWIDPVPFQKHGFSIIEAIEPWSANVLHLLGKSFGHNHCNGPSKGAIIASMSFPETNQMLRNAGYDVKETRLYGAEYAQGGPSCLVRLI